MSAYVVNTDTINAIVTFASRQRGSIPKPPFSNVPGEWIAISDCNLDNIANLLMAENVRSVNYRYREDDAPERVKFKQVAVAKVSPTTSRELGPMDIIKLCHCLAYQSCEHPEWESSWARSFLTHVEQLAITKLPAYDAAPWGLY